MMEIDSLPDDILVMIFSYLSLVELVDSVRLTSWRWHSLSYDFVLWRVVRVRENKRGLQGFRNAILQVSNSIEELSIECPDQTYLEMIRKEKSRFTKMKRFRLLSYVPNDKLLSALKSVQQSTSSVIVSCILLEGIMQFKDLRHLELCVELRHYREFLATNMLSGFPSLNTLILSGRGFPMSVVNKIYKGSPLLKKLTLKCDDLSIRAFDDMPGNCNCLVKLSLCLTRHLTEDDLIYIVGNTPNLLSLSLKSSGLECFTEKSTIFISQACKMLESLKVNVNYLSLSDAGMDTLVRNCTNLRKLHFNSKFNCGGSYFNTVPEHCRKLEQLWINIPRCFFREESIISLSERAANLSILCLQESDCITGFAISQIVINCKQLRCLMVMFCKNELNLNFDELNQKNTPCWRNFRTEFRINDTMISLDQPMGNQHHFCPVEHDIHLERRPIVSRVKVIWLYGTPISNSSLMQIAKHCPDLVTLGVSKGDIHDATAEALVKNCGLLRCLHLPGTKLTDAGLCSIVTFGLNLREISIRPPTPFQTMNIDRFESEPFQIIAEGQTVYLRRHVVIGQLA